MRRLHRITACLWFDDQAEEAAKFYTAIFENSNFVSMNFACADHRGLD